ALDPQDDVAWLVLLLAYAGSSTRERALHARRR
ncbi:MAG: hypothetical protein QOC94_2232, partial [Actinoplanes sp.]|nr:hypothetical protein [Actinoplanes sp.]